MQTLTLPALAEGERYAGLILAADGTPLHHLILLPGERESVSHAAATEWATSLEGALPTCQEQAVLFGNAKAEFEPDWYWSSEQHTSSPDYAWVQTFSNGYQFYDHKSLSSRARAIRRSPL